MIDKTLANTMTAPSPSAGSLLPYRSNGLAVGEGILLLGGLAALNYSGVLAFAVWPVHPFLFVVILLSAQYGIQGGILSALGAIALSHLDGWPARPFDMTYAEYFRVSWADALSWMLAALTVGVVTTHQAREMQDRAVKLRRAVRAENLIAAQYEVLVQRTHDLERSLAGRAGNNPADDDRGVPAAELGVPPQRAKASRPVQMRH